MKVKLSLNNIDNVVLYIISKLKDHSVVLLNGTLASGKTTLVSKLINTLGLSNSGVTSPTFNICSIYDNRVYHYDMYNSSSDDFIRLGLLEQLDTPAIHLIEWSDDKLRQLIDSYGWHKIVVNIDILDDIRGYEVIDE